MRFAALALLIVFISGGEMGSIPGGESGLSHPVRVMTYNLRYGAAADGENHWDRRKDFLADTIKAFDPDLLGTQEALQFQRDFLSEKLAAYGVLGVGRDDGAESGEMAALYYKRSRFEKLEGGTFWLSKTPDQPGSKGWDAALPRIVTWVVLRDRQQPQARPVAFYNTHFDHAGQQARLNSAGLLRQKIADLNGKNAVIVTGDFNSGEDTPAYRHFFGLDLNLPSLLRDVYRLSHPQAAVEEGTFTGFNPGNVRGPRIDWIAISSEWQVLESQIVRTARDGRFPSDHFPVTAILARTGDSN